MQVRADSQLFAAGDLQDLALESAAFGDIGDDREAMGLAVDMRECGDTGRIERRTVAASAFELDRRQAGRVWSLTSAGRAGRGAFPAAAR